MSSKGHTEMPALYRPTHDRMLAGVCSGLARRFGMSANVVRLIFVLSMLLPGPQVLIYLGGWILIPNESSSRV
jgi:phage shock protein PspC (stress-responsive transcriptional regulator)